jgi:hypothetical protein
VRPIRTTNKRWKSRFWKALAKINRERGELPSHREARANDFDMQAYFRECAARHSAAVKLCGTGPTHRRGGRFKEPPRNGWAKKPGQIVEGH